MIAILEAHRAGLLGRAHWARNIVSGIVVGVVALPLAMAFAIASGAKPEQGLYTAIVAGLLVSTFGGSRLQIAGPTGAFIVILSGITAEYGIDGLQIATFLAGLMLLLLGIARLGGIIKFIPDPVILGFTAGIARGDLDRAVARFLRAAGGHRRSISTRSFGTRCRCCRRRIWKPRRSRSPTLADRRIRAALADVQAQSPGRCSGLLFATVVQAVFHFEGVATIGSAFGGIPRGLPTLQMPEITAARVHRVDRPGVYDRDARRDRIVAVGGGRRRHGRNAPRLQSGTDRAGHRQPGGASVRRFRRHRRAGAERRPTCATAPPARSPVSCMRSTLVLIVLALAPLAVNIPLAALAAILFVVAWNMSEARHFVKMVRRAPPADVVVLLVTFGLTVFVDLVVAVNIGVIIATLHFLRRMASSVEVQQLTPQQLTSEFAHRGLQIPPGVLVFAIEGPFFFGAVENFERALASTAHRSGSADHSAALGAVHRHHRSADARRGDSRPAATQGAGDAHWRERARHRQVTARRDRQQLIGEQNFCANLEQALERLSPADNCRKQPGQLERSADGCIYRSIRLRAARPGPRKAAG